MSEKLLPCPFCGGEAVMVKTQNCGRYVGCLGCGARTEETETDYAGSAYDKALTAWNRRAQPENSRQHALQTGVCPMCEDCPDGCPVETPNDNRNRPENEPLTCEGCVDKGQYENEVEYGYPSPCTRCKRRSPDNYRRKPERSEG